MKYFLTTLLLISFFINSNAQLDKTTWLVGGMGNFSNTNDEFKNDIPNTTQKNTFLNLKFSPKIGYFILDKFATGLVTSFSFEKNKGGDLIDINGNVIGSGLTSKTTRFDFGPFLRYHFLNKEKPLNVFTEFVYQYGIDNTGVGGIKTKRNTITFNAGTEIYFNSSVGIEILIGYQNLNQKGEGVYSYTDSRNSILFGVGFNFHLIK